MRLSEFLQLFRGEERAPARFGLSRTRSRFQRRDLPMAPFPASSAESPGFRRETGKITSGTLVLHPDKGDAATLLRSAEGYGVAGESRRRKAVTVCAIRALSMVCRTDHQRRT